MKKLAKILIGFFSLTLLTFCGGGSEKGIAEMEDFLKNGFGSSKNVSAGLQKHSVAGIDKKDMDMYDLKNPVITASEKKGSAICYTTEAKAGVTTRTYILCWENGKIVKIEDKGMK